MARRRAIPPLCVFLFLLGVNLTGRAEAQSAFTHRIGIKLPRVPAERTRSRPSRATPATRRRSSRDRPGRGAPVGP
jgi:hypothetical protein